MSFENKGSLASTVVVSRAPNLSGNYVCSGAADEVEINLALAEANRRGGGRVLLLEGTYTLAATLSVPVDVMLQGAGWNTVLNYNAGGSGITVTGDNVKIRDLKIDIVAGAGAGGTRPNCIFADTRTNLEITKVWLVGDETVADDGSDVRQCGIVFDTVTYSKIALCRINDHMRHGIALDTSNDYNTVVGNTCNGNTQQGIRLDNSDDNTVTGNTCQGNAQSGIRLDTSDDNTVTGNICCGNGFHGIRLEPNSFENTVTGNICCGNGFDGIILNSDASDNTVIGNTCNGNTRRGITLGASFNNTLTGNTCNGNTVNGISLAGANDNNTLVGNTCNDNVQHGIQLDDSSDNTIDGNSCSGNDSENTGSFDGINITDISLDNLVHSNTCDDNDRYGIYIDDVLALRNWVKNNQLRGNTSGPFLDATANLTKLAVAAFQFTEAVNGAIVTVSPTGVDVDATTEAALAWGQLPVEIQRVVRLKIWAVATDAPIGTPGQMHLEVTFNAGASNAAYNTAGKSWNIVNFDGEETDYVANDVVHWIIEDGDVGTELSNLLAGDSFEIFAIWEVGADPDGATDALFRVVEVEYV